MDKLRTDRKRRSEGVWQRYYTAEEEGEKHIDVKLASMRDPEFRAHCNRLYRPHSRRLIIVGSDAGSEISDREWQRICRPAVAKHIVKDWRGAEEMGDDGNIVSVPCTYANIMRFLEDEDLPFEEWVWRVSGNDYAYRADLVEQAKGECAAPSDGGSSTDGANK